MNLSNVKVRLSEQDIIGIIKEYIKIEGLNIEKIEINENIIVYGNYKKGIKISFRAKIKVIDIIENSIKFQILTADVAGIHIFSKVKNFAMNKIADEFKQYGISVYKDILIVNLNTICSVIPYVKFKLLNLILQVGYLEAEAENIIYDINKEGKEPDKEEEDDIPKNINKVYDKYTEIRKKAQNEVCEKYKPILEYILIVPDMVILLGRLMKDKRVSYKTKCVIGGTIAYLVSPIDIVLNFIPFVGEIDDIAVIFYCLNYVINNVKKNIILENWQGKDDIMEKVEDGVEFLNKFFGGNNVSKFIAYVKFMNKSKKLGVDK